MENVTWWLAFGGGFLSFISPCCLPLYPSFISYITGMSISELKERRSEGLNRFILTHALAFLIGFSLIFYVLGFSASWIGTVFSNYQDLIRMLGGVFVTAMGLFLIGIIRPKFMMQEFRLPFRKGNTSFFNSVLVGAIFSAGWTPCIGPIFSAIMYANVIHPTQTFINVTAYSLGFSLPFMVMAFLLGKVRITPKYSHYLMKIGGGVMIVLGILLYTDKMTYINVWFSNIAG